ncbi:MAG: hypothetical protein O3B84_08470, partial [Chloroflexi bacterium]|nr:hypothetical protein [Chloroflexota bacterium]
MKNLTIPRLIVKRLADEWRLLTIVFVGTIVAVTIGAGAPTYLKALEQLAFRVALDRIDAPHLNLTVFAARVPMTETGVKRGEELVEEIARRHLEDIYAGHNMHLRGPSSIVGHGETPLPPSPNGTYPGGYLTAVTSLEQQFTAVEGRLPTNNYTGSRDRPNLEVVVTEAMAEAYDLSIGDAVFIAPAVGGEIRLNAEIVGIVAPADANSEFWNAAQPVFAAPVPDETFAPPGGILFTPDYPYALTVISTDQTARTMANRSSLSYAFQGNVPGGTVRQIGPYFMGTPSSQLPPLQSQGAVPIVSNGYFHYLTDMENNVNVLEGRLATSDVTGPGTNPVVEAIIAAQVAKEFKFNVGDVVTVAPDAYVPVRISARIVGIIEADDFTGSYWADAGIFLATTPVGAGETPTPPPDGVRWNGNDDYAIGLFVTREVMTNVLGPSYPGLVANPIIFARLDKTELSRWPTQQFLERLDPLEADVLNEMPGSSVNLGTVRGLIGNIGQRVFYSRIPLLLLIAVMIATVIFYLAMMISYLVRSRER